MTQHQTDERQVTLWVRPFEPVTAGPKQESAVAHLEGLRSRGVIDAVDIGIWGRQVELEDSRVPQIERIVTAVDAFTDWANRNGRQLEPFFNRREVCSMITDDSTDVCRLPTCALAEYEGDQLVSVAPSRNPKTEQTVTVEQRLKELADGSALSFTETADRTAPDRLEYSSPSSL